MELTALVLACVALVVALGSPIAGFYAGRRASIDTYQDLGIAFEKERGATANLRDDVLEMLERTQVERRRITGERSRMQQTAQGPNNGAPELGSMDREAQIEAVRARYEKA